MHDERRPAADPGSPHRPQDAGDTSQSTPRTSARPVSDLVDLSWLRGRRPSASCTGCGRCRSPWTAMHPVWGRRAAVRISPALESSIACAQRGDAGPTSDSRERGSRRRCWNGGDARACTAGGREIRQGQATVNGWRRAEQSSFRVSRETSHATVDWWIHKARSLAAS